MQILSTSQDKCIKVMNEIAITVIIKTHKNLSKSQIEDHKMAINIFFNPQKKTRNNKKTHK